MTINLMMYWSAYPDLQGKASLVDDPVRSVQHDVTCLTPLYQDVQAQLFVASFRVMFRRHRYDLLLQVTA